MLETIPIVKFGEKEDDKNGQQAGDTELGVSPETRHAGTSFWVPSCLTREVSAALYAENGVADDNTQKTKLPR